MCKANVKRNRYKLQANCVFVCINAREIKNMSIKILVFSNISEFLQQIKIFLWDIRTSSQMIVFECRNNYVNRKYGTLLSVEQK